MNTIFKICVSLICIPVSSRQRRAQTVAKDHGKYEFGGYVRKWAKAAANERRKTRTLVVVVNECAPFGIDIEGICTALANSARRYFSMHVDAVHLLESVLASGPTHTEGAALFRQGRARVAGIDDSCALSATRASLTTEAPCSKYAAC
nr:hypothetical protein [Paraburkholderia youngii]